MTPEQEFREIRATLDQIKDRLDGMTLSLELERLQNIQEHRQFTERMTRVARVVDRLAAIAESHERRLEHLEGAP